MGDHRIMSLQGDDHPHPGRAYTGTTRVAYLPSSKEGDEILELLKVAWSRRLLFTVGTSVTTGQADQVMCVTCLGLIAFFLIKTS